MDAAQTEAQRRGRESGSEDSNNFALATLG